MKIIHILKRIDAVDQDIKELKKLEKSLEKNKSFAGPIFMTIEKQINILLGERIKLLELEIKNPPANLVNDEDGTSDVAPILQGSEKPKKKSSDTVAKKEKVATPKVAKKPVDPIDDDDDIPMPMYTQDAIDRKFEQMKNAPKEEKKREEKKIETSDDDNISDESVKLLDVALSNGALDKGTIQKEKKRIQFFRNNFPDNE